MSRSTKQPTNMNNKKNPLRSLIPHIAKNGNNNGFIAATKLA